MVDSAISDGIFYSRDANSGDIIPYQFNDVVFCDLRKWKSRFVKKHRLSSKYWIHIDIYDGTKINYLLVEGNTDSFAHKFGKQLLASGLRSYLDDSLKITNLSHRICYYNPRFSFVRNPNSEHKNDPELEVYDIFRENACVGWIYIKDCELFEKERKYEI